MLAARLASLAPTSAALPQPSNFIKSTCFLSSKSGFRKPPSLNFSASVASNFGKPSFSKKFVTSLSTSTAPLYRVDLAKNALSRLYSEKALRKALTKEQDAVLDDEVKVLENLRDTLLKMEASPDDLALMRSMLQQLEELFLLVVVGEFNAGKSSFINALLGKKYLKDGVTPTTSKITILKYGDKFDVGPAPDNAHIEQVTIPVEWLQDINIVDTPGTNAVMREHQTLTEHFVPRSDLVLFLTSTDRAFSESERQFLQMIKQYNKKIVVIVSKLDVLETEEDLKSVMEFVSRNSRQLLGSDPPIFPVSSRLALRAKTVLSAKKEGTATAGGQNLNPVLNIDPNQLLSASRFPALEDYVLKTLDPAHRARLKLENPAGVADHLIQKYVSGLEARQAVVKGDLEVLNLVEELRRNFAADMEADFRHQRDRIDNILLKLLERSAEWLDSNISFFNIGGLLSGAKLRTQFEKDVVGDSITEIEHLITDMVEWLADKDRRFVRNVVTQIQSQASSKSDRVVSQAYIDQLSSILNQLKVNAEFQFGHDKMVEGIVRNAKQITEQFDKVRESARLSSAVNSALLQTAAVEVGAIGIGSIIATALIDLSGIVAASILAVSGLGILPYKRSQLKKSMKEKIEQMRKQLSSTLERHFKSELLRIDQRLNDTIAPYTAFVKSEHKKIETFSKELDSHRIAVAQIKEHINKAFPSRISHSNHL